MKFESVIFDIDGTLWDARPTLAKAYNVQQAAENITGNYVSVQRLTPLMGKTMTTIADNLFPMLPPQERYTFMDRCIATTDRLIEQEANPDWGFPGLRQTMETLKERHRLFIVSNGQSGYGQLAAEKLGIADLMDGYLCFGDTGLPKGQTILRLLELHDIKSAVYVGDIQGDLDACREAGIDFIWAAYGFGTPEEYWAKIDAFAQLADL